MVSGSNVSYYAPGSKKIQRRPVFGAVYTQDVEEIYKAGRNQQKYHTAYVPAFICDILDRRRRRYKLCTTDTGAQFDKDNTDLYSCGSRNSGGDTAEKAPAE